MFRNTVRFYSEELLAPCPSPKLEDHNLSAFRDCLLKIPSISRGRSSTRNLKTRHTVVTVTDLSWDILMSWVKYKESHGRNLQSIALVTVTSTLCTGDVM
jgi:hypothetical protein